MDEKEGNIYAYSFSTTSGTAVLHQKEVGLLRVHFQGTGDWDHAG
jgi:hypothetical protein